MLQPKLLEELEYWITERENIRVKKESGAPRPWSADVIFRQFKFCNVRREDDRVTRWFKANWRAEQYWDEKNFIPAIMFARTINWPATLEKIGFPFDWEPIRILKIMDQIQSAGEKVYTGAYMITAGPTGVRKNAWVVGNADSYFARPPKLNPSSIQKSWETIINNKYPCVGPFIAGQIIADLKHTKHLKAADDWWTWAALGPGSARGLNRMHARPLDFLIPQPRGLAEMIEIREKLGLGWLCLQDVQNCLCEFDKWKRVRLGQGKPRASYPGVI